MIGSYTGPHQHPLLPQTQSFALRVRIIPYHHLARTYHIQAEDCNQLNSGNIVLSQASNKNSNRTSKQTRFIPFWTDDRIGPLLHIRKETHLRKPPAHTTSQKPGRTSGHYKLFLCNQSFFSEFTPTQSRVCAMLVPAPFPFICWPPVIDAS